MIAAGKLNKQIQIESVSESRTASGAVTETWSTFATVWSEFLSQTGREFFAAKQINNALDVVVKIRYISGITAKMRVKYGTRLFMITSPPINVGMKNEQLQLMCEELRG